MKAATEYNENPTYRRMVDDLFSKVERHILRFAAGKGLHVDRWYHDTPVWILGREEGRIRRNIYIGPVSEIEKFGLSVAVLAYQDDGRLSQRRTLKEGIVVGQVGASSLRDNPEGITALLEMAYRKVMSVTEKELVPR
jgi:hypothetical protein